MQHYEVKVGQRVKVVSVESTDIRAGINTGDTGTVDRVGGGGCHLLLDRKDIKADVDGRFFFWPRQLELVVEEAAPVAEPRAFNVGDLVRKAVDDASRFHRNGDTGKVVENLGGGTVCVSWENPLKPNNKIAGGWYIEADKLELVQAVDDAPTLSVPPSPLDVYRAAHAKHAEAQAAAVSARDAHNAAVRAAGEADRELQAARDAFLAASVA